MSIIAPEIEFVDRTTRSIRYLEHGWPSELCRWHSHEEYELHLIIATRGKAFVGDHIGEFKAGDLFLTGPNLPHNWVTDEGFNQKVDTRDMLVQFNQDSFDKLAEGFPEFTDLRGMLNMAQSGVYFDGFDHVVARQHLKAIRDSHGANRILALLKFLLLVNEHANKVTLSTSKLIQPEGGSKHARIGAVIDHIVAHYKDDLSVTQAADMAGMTQATFSRNFQTVSGHKFVEFVNRVRIGQACGMLYASDEQVTTICYQAGFQNLANFNRHFLRMKGMTPSAYRETARKDLVPHLEKTT